MAKSQYLDLTGLTQYDEQIKSLIDSKDTTVVTNLTNGTTVVKKAETATSATTATTATKLGSSSVGSSSQPIYLNSGTATKVTSVGVSYGGTGATSASGARTNLGVYSTSEVDSKVSTAVSGLASSSSVTSAISTHNSATDAHSDIRSAIAEVKEDVDTFFADADFTASAKDTLKEIQDYITSDVSAAADMTASINNKADKTHTHAISDVTNLQSTLNAKAAASDLTSHTGNTTVHITATERTNWNAAKTHADSTHAPSNAEPNQNAFSNIVIGSTTIAADSTTDSLTLDGSNVTLTADTTNDKVTISVANGTTSTKGVVQLTNSTSSTSTTTAATPSSVKSAYDRASTAITNAATAQSTADSAKTTAEDAATAAAANTTAISSNTSSINTHTSQITALQNKIGDGIEAIPEASITALFSA